MTQKSIFARKCFTALAVTALMLSAANTRARAETVVSHAVNFSDASTLATDASGMTLDVLQRPPHEYPHVGFRAPFTFEDAARDWAAHHFNLTGNSVNSLRITLREGDITEKPLPVKKGIAGWFRKDQSAEYEAHLNIEAAIIDPNGRVLAQAEGKAWHTRTVAEGTTEEQKRAVWSEMIKKTFDDLDIELQPKIRQALAQYVH